MVQIKTPNAIDLYNPVLKSLHTLGGSGDLKKIYETLVAQEQYTRTQLEKSTNSKIGQPKSIIYKNFGWALTYLKHYGLTNNPARGYWELTDKGKSTHRVDAKAVMKYVTEKRGQKKYQVVNKTVETQLKKKLASNATYFTLDQLEATLHQRRIRRPEGSYTAELFAAGPARIAQKVGEEALEVIIAALHESRERQISEVADLLVHTLILLVELNIPLEEVLNELERRHEARSS